MSDGGEFQRLLVVGRVVGTPVTTSDPLLSLLSSVDKNKNANCFPKRTGTAQSKTIFHQGGLNDYAILCVKQAFCCCTSISDHCHPHANCVFSFPQHSLAQSAVARCARRPSRSARMLSAQRRAPNYSDRRRWRRCGCEPTVLKQSRRASEFQAR